jgi:hypothetical protein
MAVTLARLMSVTKLPVSVLMVRRGEPEVKESPETVPVAAVPVSEQADRLHRCLRRKQGAQLVVHLLRLLQGRELGKLGHEFRVVHGLERILVAQLGNQDFQEVLDSDLSDCFSASCHGERIDCLMFQMLWTQNDGWRLAPCRAAPSVRLAAAGAR